MKRPGVCLGALTLGVLLPITTAHAQSRSLITEDAGWYWWVDAGVTIPFDGHVTQFGTYNSRQKVTYDIGGSLDLGLGYAFNKYVATELQVGGSWNSVKSIEGASCSDTYFASMPILANVVLRYPIPGTRVVPYLGAGAGGAVTVFDTDGLTRSVPGGWVTLYGSASDFEFAWQAFAGVRIELNDKMSIGVGYRYLQVNASTFDYGSEYGGATLELGLSRHQAHMAAITFELKF